MLSRSGVSDSLRSHGLQAAGLLHPWDFPGKNMEWVATSFSTIKAKIFKFLSKFCWLFQVRIILILASI